MNDFQGKFYIAGSSGEADSSYYSRFGRIDGNEIVELDYLQNLKMSDGKPLAFKWGICSGDIGKFL